MPILKYFKCPELADREYLSQNLRGQLLADSTNCPSKRPRKSVKKSRMSAIEGTAAIHKNISNGSFILKVDFQPFFKITHLPLYGRPQRACFGMSAVQTIAAHQISPLST
jgi:hypothetical protein